MNVTKILIQHTETMKYLKGAGTWTDEIDEALFFGTNATAAAYCKSCNLEAVRLVSKPESVQE